MGLDEKRTSFALFEDEDEELLSSSRRLGQSTRVMCASYVDVPRKYR